MKILYFSQFYTPESIAAAFRAGDNARIWSENGHDVTVFTGYPNYPAGRIFDGYDAKLFREERIGNVRVLRSKLVAKPNTSMLNRLQNALSFFFFGLVNICFNGRKIGSGFDVVLGTSGVIFSALLGWLYAFFHRLPFVFEIRDITYRQMIATGKGEKSLSVKLMRWLELFLCKRAAKVVVVTNGFREILASDGIPAEKIEVITNGVDVKPVSFSPQAERELTLSYFGTLGISQNIPDTFPYAEEMAKLCESFTYLIIGEGAQRGQIEEAIQTGQHSFIELLPGMPAKELEPYYRRSRLSLVVLKKSSDFRYTLPSKLFQVMGRGIAVLFIGPDGEAAEIIRQFNAGIALTGTREEDLTALRSFFAAPDWRQRLEEMGQNGAAAARAHYSRTSLALRYIQLLTECASI